MEATCKQTGILSAPSRGHVSVKRRAPAERLRHEGALLVLAFAAIAVSFALPALKTRGFSFGIPCLFYKLTHIPCFACGLTRSFVYTAHGDFTNAFRMHLLGPILFALACGAVVYLAVVVTIGKKINLGTTKRQRAIASWVFFGVLVVCWVIKLVFMQGTW